MTCNVAAKRNPTACDEQISHQRWSGHPLHQKTGQKRLFLALDPHYPINQAICILFLRFLKNEFFDEKVMDSAGEQLGY